MGELILLFVVGAITARRRLGSGHLTAKIQGRPEELKFGALFSPPGGRHNGKRALGCAGVGFVGMALNAASKKISIECGVSLAFYALPQMFLNRPGASSA